MWETATAAPPVRWEHEKHALLHNTRALKPMEEKKIKILFYFIILITLVMRLPDAGSAERPSTPACTREVRSASGTH